MSVFCRLIKIGPGPFHHLIKMKQPRSKALKSATRSISLEPTKINSVH